MGINYTPALLILSLAANAQKAVVTINDSLSRPNIILIQMDDLGWDDLSYHQNKYVETKNIDQLAAQSLVFDRFYVNPVSAPSRASLLTGRFFLRTGVSHVHGGKDFLNLKEQILPQVLKRAGYQTSMFGKWHSGMADGYYPWQRGFDIAFSSDLYRHQNASGYLNGVRVTSKLWSDELITNYAVNYIKKQTSPFFMYLSFLTCHSPLEAPQQLIDKYQAKGLSSPLATLYAMVDMADGQIGRLMKFLSDSGMDSNTIVLFLSDNGPARNSDVFTDSDRAIRYVSNMRGHKGDIYENAVKSPFFIRWKGKIKPARSNQLCDITDILPTLTDITGSSQFVRNKLDGISLLTNINNGDKLDKTVFNYANIGWIHSENPWTPEGIFDEYAPVSKSQKKKMQSESQIISIIKGDDKLMLNPNASTTQPESPEIILVNVLKDNRELINCADSEPEKSESLKQLLVNWFDGIKRETNSFMSPVFNVTKDTIEIPAKGASFISEDVKKTYNSIRGWSSNSRVDIKVDVCKSDFYTVEVMFDKTPANQLEFIVNKKSVPLEKFSDTTLKSSRKIKLNKNITMITIKACSQQNTQYEDVNFLKVKLTK